MPSTREISRQILQQAHGWQVDGARGVLPYINEIHRYMVAHDSETNVYIDPATGLPPYLTTVDGTRQYTMADNVRKIASVFFDESVPMDYGDAVNYDNYGNYLWIKGTRYREVKAGSRPKNRSSNATITFQFNPGTTTDIYFTKYYIVPTEITSVSIDLDIPDEYHDLVVDGVVARIRAVQYGNNDTYLMWRNERVPNEYWLETNENPNKDDLIPLRWG